MYQKNKIIFIADGLPANTNAGGILYGNIIKRFGVKSFYYINIGWKLDRNKMSDNFSDLIVKQYSFRLPVRGKVGKYIRKIPFLETIFMILSRKIQLNSIINYAKSLNCNLVFAVLRADSLLVLNRIVEELNIPLIGYISDTVETEDVDHKIIYKIKYREYYEIIDKCTILAVAGETMREFFNKKYNKEPIILRVGFKNQPDFIIRKIKKNLNIVFSGSMYGRDELVKFLSACDKYASINPNIVIKVYIASQRKIEINYDGINVENLGWIDEQKLLEILRNCHIGYLPYKFNKNNRFQMTYAFPTKAGLYISFNLPIFFHGPTYSSFNYFLKEYEVGISCRSLNIDEIISKLDLLVKDEDFYLKCQAECQRAFEKEFSEKVFNKTINKIFESGSVQNHAKLPM